MKKQKDFLYATTDVAIWSCSETGLAITAACSATLRPLLRSWPSMPGFDKSGGATTSAASHGYKRAKGAASPGSSLSKMYQGRQGAYSVRLQSEHDRDALEEMRDETELDRITKSSILVEPCDSASVESAAASQSSTANIVHR